MTLPTGVAGYECKHAFYTEATDGSRDDIVLVKRNIHKEDGSIVPDVKFVQNYERDFYVVNEAHRTYTEKKAWEDEFKCRKFTCRQPDLTDAVQRALGRNPSGYMQRSIVFRSPYVYGADITTTALIKKSYMDKFEEFTSESTMGVMDIETDVVNGDGSKIISASFTYKNNVHIAYTKEFIGQLHDHERKLQEKYKYYIGQLAGDLEELLAGDTLSKGRRQVLERAAATLRERSELKIVTKLCGSPAEVTIHVFDAAHATKPDFVVFWNMNFDLPKMIASLEYAGIDPKYVFSDPSLPERFKRFKYRPGQAIKQIAGGRTMSKHPAELWHVVDAPASFFCIDAMCVFKQVRVTEGNRNSYSLDAILNDELNLGKLKFKEADHLSGLEWHVYMQQNHKIEYLIYNIFDCMSIEILDAKTKDIALTVPTLCQHSDYAKFPSTPRRLCDDMHFYLKSHKKVISTTSDDMAEELDKHVVGSNNWIITLPSHLVDDNGLQLLEEAPHVRSMLRVHVADLDVASSYPNTGSFMNMSMETTERELVAVTGVDEVPKRMAGLNLTAARTNAVECSNTFFKFPTMNEVLDEYRKQKES